MSIYISFAPRSIQITTSAPHHSIFYRPDALPDAQPTVSKHSTGKQKTSINIMQNVDLDIRDKVQADTCTFL